MKTDKLKRLKKPLTITFGGTVGILAERNDETDTTVVTFVPLDGKESSPIIVPGYTVGNC